MFWRVRGRDFDELWGDGARAAFREVVEEGPPPGLLAYRDGAPVGWCAVAPRESYPRVLRSRVIGPADDAPACWAVVCFYVVRGDRRGGVAAALLEAAVAFAADHGATWVEGYPKDTEGARKGANEMFVGSMSMFAEAGCEGGRPQLPPAADHAPAAGGERGSAAAAAPAGAEVVADHVVAEAVGGGRARGRR